MDKIWYRNLSKREVIGRCGGGEKIRMTPQNRQKSNAKNKFKNKKVVNYVMFDLLKIQYRQMCRNEHATQPTVDNLNTLKCLEK